jgi:D-glycero-D-manno-heptose 1,7-bisphosphate phosphatase
VSTHRAVFLDRDGVINGLTPDPTSGRRESPLHAADVVLLDGVAQAMQELASASFLLIGASNQPAAAKGTVSQGELVAVHERVISLLQADGASFDDFYICWHHPDGTDPTLGGTCDCRKPAPGMLLAAAHEHDIDLERSWMVGDSDSDVVAGSAAGVRTVLIEHSDSLHRRQGAAGSTLVAADLPAAVRALLDCVGR